MVLDEPTNHLDILAREAVEAALEAFDGTVLVVSHDRYFINEIVGRIWEIEDGQIIDYKGDYSFYMEEKAKRLALASAAETAAPKEKTKQTENKKTISAKAESKERRYSPQDRERLLAKVELNIREQEALLGLLEKQMADPSNHADPLNSAKLADEYEKMKSDIDSLMKKWEELMLDTE